MEEVTKHRSMLQKIEYNPYYNTSLVLLGSIVIAFDTGDYYAAWFLSGFDRDCVVRAMAQSLGRSALFAVPTCDLVRWLIFVPSSSWGSGGLLLLAFFGVCQQSEEPR